MLSINKSTPSSPAAPATGTPESIRFRTKKRDESIRKRTQEALVRQQSTKKTPKKPKISPVDLNSVASLKPAPALKITDKTSIFQAARHMVAKKTDAALVIDENDALIGILTDKDIAYRVVAAGLDVYTTTVSSIMTKDPFSVSLKGNRNDALEMMVSKKFRHLPVLAEIENEADESATTSKQNIVGLLDITKCVFDKLSDLEAKVIEDDEILTAVQVLEKRGLSESLGVGLKQSHGCPTIGNVLASLKEKGGDDFIPEVLSKSTIRQVAQTMKEYHQTAALVINEGDDKVSGIITTKDIILRVIAGRLDVSTTSAVRAMTFHPDFVKSDDTILHALVKLKVGHFLHLPVMDGDVPIGLVDVMTLTISMLTYLMSKYSKVEESGPVWNHFWNNTLNETESDDVQTLDSNGNVHNMARNSVLGISQELCGNESVKDAKSEISFKLSDLFKNVNYHFSMVDCGFSNLVQLISDKTEYSISHTSINGKSMNALKDKSGHELKIFYYDEDKDAIELTSDKDLSAALGIMNKLGDCKLKLYVDRKVRVRKSKNAWILGGLVVGICVGMIYWQRKNR